MFVDDELEYQRIRYSLLMRFNLMYKLKTYQNNPNFKVTSDESKIILQKEDNDTLEYEEYRVVDYYGHTAMQFRKERTRLIVNLRCYPEGYANFNRGIMMICTLQNEGIYRIDTIVVDNNNLTDMNNIFSTDIPIISGEYLESCFDETEELLGRDDYRLLKDHLEALKTLLTPEDLVRKLENK